MEPTLDIAKYVSELRLEDVPSLAIERAKVAILDTLGVALAGSTEQAGRILVSYASSGTWSGEGVGATIFGHPLRVSPETAALVNGSFAHVLDYDDRGHSSVHTLPAVLAVAEDGDLSGEDVLLGFIVGREVRLRLNDSIDGGGSKSGAGSPAFHATGVLGAIATSAGVGRLVGLDVERMAMGLGIAASLASGVTSNRGTMTKSLHAGNAARNGVLSALLAAEGFTGDPSVFSSPGGFIEAICPDGGPDMEMIATSLRGSFHICDRGVRVKPYPSCSPSHRYIETVRALVAEHGLTAEDVVSVECTSTPSLNRPHPQNALEGKFSASFAIAATLIDGAVTLENCQDDFLSRPDVQDLLGKIHEGPAHREGEGWVRVTMRDGAERVHELIEPRNLDTFAAVSGKFSDCAVPVIGEQRAASVVDAVQGLEKLESVRGLVSLLGVAG